ncbi:unnamed protein product [Cochlearia groenlandica]
MVHHENLPWELIEDILSRVHPKSLVRFRAVSKQWNLLFDDKTFIENHKLMFRFVLATKSKIYSVSIDSEIVLRELTLDVGGLEPRIPNYLVNCDKFVICGLNNGAAIWNPWLSRGRNIKTIKAQQPTFKCHGMGYDTSSMGADAIDIDYKTIWCYSREPDSSEWRIIDYASHAWKDVNFNKYDGDDQREDKGPMTVGKRGVLLNGSLYWVAFVNRISYFRHLIYFDFSREKFFMFCDLPCGKSHHCDALVLDVFKGDRFSLVKQSKETKKIEVWVTKDKIICNVDGNDVVWMSFMTLSVPDLPDFVWNEYHCEPSYYIDDNMKRKRLVVCSYDETGRVWIYVMEDNKLVSKTQIDSVVDCWPLHCAYFPNLMPVPLISNKSSKKITSFIDD